MATRQLTAAIIAVLMSWQSAESLRLNPTRATATGADSKSPARAAGERPPIYCNRAVNLGRMEATGFDMDHTLAQYKAAPFDALAYNGAIAKLVELGYPQEILAFRSDITRYQRGLVIDRARGNILKMDRHKYVKVAHHGLSEMGAEERKELYDRQRPSFNPPDFANIDTAFLLVDVCLYCQLVDLKDASPELLPHRSYAQLYSDVRRAVDLCHCDGVIKDPVMADPAKYIDADPEMAGMLDRIRSAGQRPFLVTNSAWEYTEAVMSFLLGADAAAFGHADWTGFFDVIIVGARKPAFLLDANLPIFRVRPDGALLNLENAEFSSPASVTKVLAAGKIFQGGTYNHLHKLVGLSSFDRLLYVGTLFFSFFLMMMKLIALLVYYELLPAPRCKSHACSARPFESSAPVSGFRLLAHAPLIAGTTCIRIYTHM
mmetsp:Transcript_27308/g.63912  ORF Transcript_27308/g.63912 Transcript_27308/m.63912 type:complete len:431 (+) Transcript_27308:104-1396(+)